MWNSCQGGRKNIVIVLMQKLCCLRFPKLCASSAAGGCERLLSTPIPLSYTRHTSRSMMLFLISLAPAIYPSMGLTTPMAVAVITFIFIGESVDGRNRGPCR
jgi:predicted membrane chloride channel (bestrophin family)